MRMCSVNECFRILLLTVVLTQSSHVGLTGESQPLKVNLKILNQKYCSGESSISAVQLALRLEVFNVTHKTLIVQKSIGRAWYREIVARDEESLAAGDFEYNPNIEFLPTKSDEQVPSTDAPGDDFILLGPGKSFEAESLVDIPTRTGALSPLNKGLIQAGDHVLQLRLTTWTLLSQPETFRKSWQRYGELVYEKVKSEPLRLRVPPESELESCKH
jgi:hypothetical protein